MCCHRTVKSIRFSTGYILYVITVGGALSYAEDLHAFDFLLRHAMQAVLTHLRLADAAESLSRLLDLGFGVLVTAVRTVSPVRCIVVPNSVFGACAIGHREGGYLLLSILTVPRRCSSEPHPGFQKGTNTILIHRMLEQILREEDVSLVRVCTSR